MRTYSTISPRGHVLILLMAFTFISNSEYIQFISIYSHLFPYILLISILTTIILQYYYNILHLYYFELYLCRSTLLPVITYHNVSLAY